MSNKAGNFANNLAVVSNITALTAKTLGKISDQQDLEISQTTRELLVARITQRVASNLRNKPIEG